MAHKVIAADLGASAIKLARFETSFRKAALHDFKVIPVSSTGRADERIAQQLQVLAQSMSAEDYQGDEVVLGLPGEVLSFRLVDLPFATPRQIESVLEYELESQILVPTSELVIDFVIVGPVRGPAAGVPGSGGSGETRVLAACAPRFLVENIIKTAQESQLPLRAIGASPLAYASLLAGDAAVGLGLLGPGTSLVVDLGAEATTVLALNAGRPEMARSIGRGGRHLTEAVAAAFRLDETQAERAKAESGFIAHAGTPPLSQAQSHMDTALRAAMQPLLRELRQTLAAYRASYGEGVERIYVTGGGSRLAGLAEFIEAELGAPVAPLPWPAREGWAQGAAVADKRDLMAVATGLALSTLAPATQVNFRKGDFAYRSDFSFLRAKTLHIAAALVLVVVFAGTNVWASLRGLHKDHELLAARLKKATIELFGKERTDPHAISDEVSGGPKGLGQIPIPSTTAYDLLDELSKAAPAKDKIKLDILELDIKPKKTFIKATVETAQQMDDLADAIHKIDCIEEVGKGKAQKLLITPPAAPYDPNNKDKDKDKEKEKPTELTQFTFNVKATCP